jgi:hypothetical protein
LKTEVLLLLLYFLVEFLLYIYIKKISKINKWVLLERDLYFLFNKKKFKFFKKNNYNYELGWDKKPNSVNFDFKNKKKIFYSIDKKGFRSSKLKNKKISIATFGDSYTFCRQVENSKTWQEILSKKRGEFIANYGVGNYGLDQSFLKYKKTTINKSTKIIIFGFVPETICRIQSCWKYYLEFGNLHGFKPFCTIKYNRLYFNKNILKIYSTYYDLDKLIIKTRKIDRFYKLKYKKYVFKYSYILNFIKNFLINIGILFILIKSLIKKNDFENSFVNNTFTLIMKNNIKMSHKLYCENYSKDLFEKLIKKISDNFKNNIKCYFVIFPQLFDLKLKSRRNYQDFFKKFKTKYNVIDLTNNFLLYKNYEKLFTNDKYGGHLNYRGNLLVANILKNQIN